MGFKQDFHGTSMICSDDFFGNSMGFPWVPMAVLWEFHDVSILLCDYYGIPEGILRDSLGNPMGFL